MTSETASQLKQPDALADEAYLPWFVPFEPVPWLRGGHAQTLAGNFWRRVPANLSCEPVPVVVDPEDGSRVLCHCHWQPESVRQGRLTLLLLHGLEGSSGSRYITGITDLAWQAGCNVIRMNMRNCGGTEAWSPTLYHSGLSSDVAAVLHHFEGAYGLRRVAMAGYSMGGNLVLKLAGELGSAKPEWLLAAAGVSPAMDLAESADALHEGQNRIYEWHFLRNLMRRFRSKAELFPGIYASHHVGAVRSIREFDDRITAPFSGFAGADDYYFRAASARVAGQITVPTLILHAEDDPFIRLTDETRAKLASNPAVTLLESQNGGHCAFLARTDKARTDKARRDKDRTNNARTQDNASVAGQLTRHWAETTIVRFLMATAGHTVGG